MVLVELLLAPNYCIDAYRQTVLHRRPFQRRRWLRASVLYLLLHTVHKGKNLSRPVAGRKRFFLLHVLVTTPLSGKDASRTGEK